MIQVIKRTKVDGEMHEVVMSFTAGEWKLMQKHYPSGGVSFHPMNNPEPIKAAKPTEVIKAKPGRDDDDDKPNMKDYNTVKNRAVELFNEEDWDKALYYFNAAYKLKSFGWLVGKINKCKKNIEAENIAKGKPEKE